MNKKYFLMMGAAGLLSLTSMAQTAEAVYTLFQSKCNLCHSGSFPSGGWAVGGSAMAMYNNNVGVTPNNGAAAGRGDKYITANDTTASFVYRKINPAMSLSGPDGGRMPDGGPNLSAAEINTVRQWILAGAPAPAPTAVAPADNTAAKVWIPAGIKQLHIELPHAVPGIKVELYSLTSGQLVYTTQLETARETLELSNLSAGLYLYRLINTNGATESGKVIL